MQDLPLASNPFALLVDPSAVFDAVERSERLSRLQSRICRPLDKPLLGVGEAAPADEGGGEPTLLDALDTSPADLN